MLFCGGLDWARIGQLLKHWLTVDHASRLPVYDQEASECTLCFEKRTEFVHCPTCIHEWCASCERLWAKRDWSCPYCRTELTLLQPKIYFGDTL